MVRIMKVFMVLIDIWWIVRIIYLFWFLVFIVYNILGYVYGV